MSTVIVDEIAGRRDLNHVVQMPRGKYFDVPGRVIQTAWKEFHQHGTYNAYNDATRAISALDINFACKQSDSLVYIQWWIFYEASDHNFIFRPLVNGGEITTSGYQGYNSASSSRWSGMSPGAYEHSHDASSTPTYQHMAYMYDPNTTASRTYGVGVRASNSSNKQVRLNRAWSSYSDSYEAGVSTVLVQEIGQ